MVHWRERGHSCVLSQLPCSLQPAERSCNPDAPSSFRQDFPNILGQPEQLVLHLTFPSSAAQVWVLKCGILFSHTLLGPLGGGSVGSIVKSGRNTGARAVCD